MKSKYIPVILIWFYILLFIIDMIFPSEIYSIYYFKGVAAIDTFLFILSILYYITDRTEWPKVSKKSLLTATSLNLLTELNINFQEREGDSLKYYYTIYFCIICMYFISLIIDKYKKPK